ncbi:rab-GTPase-TBC domain-containing protein [Dichotomocladium elegans]|nr:rab-GTPase-TBC domain-containing protein [Dichotomocladium elegans]
MALFANAPDLKIHANRPTPKLASCNFVASSKASDVLAQSGHLALSAPSQIIGRFQFLKTLVHENLCEYVEIHRGKHDRLFVVTEYYDDSLQKARSSKEDIEPEPIKIPLLRQYAREIFSALIYLQQNNMIHAALSPHNILLTENGHIKLCGYGLYHMTGSGADVDFPIGYAAYLAPEVVGDESPESLFHDKRDCWAVGVILVEQYCRHAFWTTSDIGLIFDSLTTLTEWANENIKPVWHHKNIETLDINKEVLTFLQGKDINGRTNNGEEIEAFRQFVLSCLSVLPAQRPSLQQILSNPFLNIPEISMEHPWVYAPIIVSEDLNPDEVEKDTQKGLPPATDILRDLPISQIYHLWRLAGGDLELNLVKRGVFLSMPVIERLPRVGFVEDGAEIGSVTVDTTQLYSDTLYILSFKELYQRLEDARRSNTERFEWDTDFFTVVDEDDVNFLVNGDASSDDKAESDLDDELVYNDEVVPPTASAFNNGPQSSTFVSSPTTPSTSRSVNRTFSLTSMTRSRSSSSLSVGTNPPSTPTGTHTTTPRRSLALREQDVNYQYHRQLLFAELLRQYPASRKEIIYHAKIDIPPAMRGKVWAAILGVQGDLEHEYSKIDKYNDAVTDRQIDVDVPRCHQYNQLLASSVGHEKLRRLLKAWVSSNKRKDWVYWQGLDSLCAPFLALNFNDEAVAFECLQKFIHKFLTNFFVKDSKPVLDDYFAVFRHLLSYHDPELSAHFDAISFEPHLYAIRWFFTLFTHVFALDKVYYLWDKFVVGPPSLPLFVGVAILQQFREDLLKYEFNGCISLFSENFPKIDIEKCIQAAMGMCKVTPPSIVALQPSSAASEEPKDWWEKALPIEIRKQELAPRIAMRDYPTISPYTLILDIRSEQEFANGHITSSMNMQASKLQTYANILKKLNRKYHVIVGPEGEETTDFAAALVRKYRLSRIAVINGGIDAVKSYYEKNGARTLCKCRPHRKTTANYRTKGSDPPFVLWQCKVPLPLAKR